MELLFWVGGFLGCVIQLGRLGFLGCWELIALFYVILLLMLLLLLLTMTMTISLLQLVINVTITIIVSPLAYIQRILTTVHHLQSFITLISISLITIILTLLYILKRRLIHSSCWTLPYTIPLHTPLIPLYHIPIVWVYYLRLCHPRAMILYRLRHGVWVMIQVVRCELELWWRKGKHRRGTVIVIWVVMVHSCGRAKIYV